MSSEERLYAYERHYNPTAALLLDVLDQPAEYSGSGTRVLDEHGVEYLDFSAGYGVFGIGHGHPRVRQAVLAQLERMPWAPASLCNAPFAALLERLASLMPGDLTRLYLTGSGSEAIEVAIHLARLARPQRRRLVAARNGYHGKTLGALGVTGQDGIRKRFAPFWSDVVFVDYGDSDSLARALRQQPTAAVLLEPVLGGGYLSAPPAGYLRDARALCSEASALLIADEVQTGFGRTGTLFGVDHDGVVPDMMVVSKGMTGGHVPVAALAVSEALIGALPEPLAYSSDSSGSPLVCAAALAALEVIVDEQLPARAQTMGRVLQAALSEVVARHPRLALGVPGRGLMLGVTLRNPAVEYAVWWRMQEHQVITGYSTNEHAAHPVLRFFPPLTVSEPEIELASAALDSVLTELERRPKLVYDIASRALGAKFFVPRGAVRRVAHWLFRGNAPHGRTGASA